MIQEKRAEDKYVEIMCWVELKDRKRERNTLKTIVRIQNAIP